MDIPLFNCQVDPVGIAMVSDVMKSGYLVTGEHVSLLETELSVRFGRRQIVALSDMTHALELALYLSGVSPGDEVLTLSYNCLSSNSAISRVGAKAVWVDIDTETASMDIDDACSKITRATRAVVVYHVAGYPADTVRLRNLCNDHGLILIEDANSAFGATLPGGATAGSIGDYSVFSFYANRQISAVEGAALVCPNDETAEQARQLRRFGINQSQFRDKLGEIDPTSDVSSIGLAATMSNVNAALARHHLALLDGRQDQIRANVRIISEALEEMSDVVPVKPVGDASPAYWTLLLLCNNRDELMASLKSQGIGCSKLHQPNHIYSGFNSDLVDLPRTDELMKKVLSIPCGWWIERNERQRIVSAILKHKS